MKFFFMKKNMWYAELVWLSLDLSSDMTHLHARQCYIVSRRNESCWERTFVTCQFIIVMSHCRDITDVHARSDYVVSRVNESRHEKNDAICQVCVIISLFVLWHDSFTCQTILCCVSRKWVMLGKNVCQIKMYHCYPAVSCDMTDVHARSEHIASQTKWVMSWKQLCDMPSSYYDLSSCPVTWLIYMARGNWYLTCCLLLCQIWNAQRQKRTHSMGKSQDTPTQKQNMCIFDWKTKKTSLSKILTVTKYDTSTWEQMCLRKIQNQKTKWISWKWKQISS